MARPKKNAKLLMAQWQGMLSDRSPWDTLWDEVLRYVMPWKKRFYSSVTTPDQTNVTYDSTAVYACNTLAGGMLSYLTPAGSPWFGFSAPSSMESNDPVEQWLKKCTEITLQNLANSNFYDEIHVAYFDDSGPGTSTIIAMPGKKSPFFFQTVPIGTYCIAEDDEGKVDTLFIEEKLTPRQCELKFGLENLSSELQKKIEAINSTGVGSQEKISVLHAIYPRPAGDREKGKIDKANKPYASCYMELATQHMLPEDGFDEQPFFSTRFSKWGTEVWGVSPALQVMADIRQLDFLSMSMDSLVDKKINPPIISPSTLAGMIDIRAGAVTYYDDPNQLPKEWNIAGDYNVGTDREKSKQDAIKRAFFVDMFQMFASIDKQMTAREVAEREAEKLVQFVPAFARKTTELLNPLLERLFGMQLRAGLFPPPPQEAAVLLPNGEQAIPTPTIQYTSRVALAIKSLANIAWQRTLERNLPLSEIRPDILDNFDFDKISRDGARNDGLPADWLLPVDKRDEMRQARAQQQAEQAQQQQALTTSEALKNAGTVKSDSPVAQALQKAA